MERILLVINTVNEPFVTNMLPSHIYKTKNSYTYIVSKLKKKLFQVQRVQKRIIIIINNCNHIWPKLVDRSERYYIATSCH